MTDEQITEIKQAARRKASRELVELVDAVEAIREQLEARGGNPTDINQTLGACYAVFLLQKSQDI